VEAAGVGLFAVDRRKLLILGTATRAKKGPLPNPLYVYCYETPLALESAQTRRSHDSIPWIRGWIEKKLGLDFAKIAFVPLEADLMDRCEESVCPPTFPWKRYQWPQF